jgi:hypothetical protein
LYICKLLLKQLRGEELRVELRDGCLLLRLEDSLLIIIRRMNKHIKNLFNKLVVYSFYFLFAIGWLLFVCLLIGGCVGNFLDVNESPFPGLHWKP